MTIRVLHAADLHLDSPFSLPNASRAPAHATLEAFTQIVSLAVREKVDAVVLAGDLYERRDRSVRARLHLQKELTRLHCAGIRSFIVHGNHDPLSADPGALALPPSTTVFGANWSEVAVTTPDGRVRFRVQGLSFAEAQVRENVSKQFHRVGPEVTVALLHCNVGGHGAHANYAPCTTQDLDAAGLDYWALGHVHTRQIMPLPSGGCAVYPGNPQGRQVNETGPRGCVIVELDEARERAPRVQFFACDVVRWHRLEVDVAAVETIDALVDTIDRCADAATGDTPVKHHVLRVVLTGRAVLHRQLTVPALAELEQAVAERFAHRPLSLESLRTATSAPFDLPRLVASGGLAGEIAKLMTEPWPATMREKVWADAGLGALTAQLEAAKIGFEPSPALLDQALARALELIALEDLAT